MAPREAQLVMTAAGELTAREMLLEAAVLSAAEMKFRGFLNRIVPDADVLKSALHSAAQIVQLAPEAARMNKKALRKLKAFPAGAATKMMATCYHYAPSAEHQEGINA